MSTPLNLTLKRGPSVWEEPKTRLSYWRLSGLAAAGLIAGLATRREATRGPLIGVAIAVGAVSLLGGQFRPMLAAVARATGARRAAKEDNLVDLVSEAS